jgi:hypothetical protein
LNSTRPAHGLHLPRRGAGRRRRRLRSRPVWIFR